MANTETRPEEQLRQWRGAQPDERLEALLERIAELEVAHQLQLLRALAPSVLAKLDDQERADLIRSLDPTGAVQ